jgi:hypothetical protein
VNSEQTKGVPRNISNAFTDFPKHAESLTKKLRATTFQLTALGRRVVTTLLAANAANAQKLSEAP